MNRSDLFSVSLDLPVAESYRPGFAYIPAGQTIIGGDPEAFDPHPISRVDIDSFYMQRYPVTFADYVEFLDAIAAKDPEQAAEHALARAAVRRSSSSSTPRPASTRRQTSSSTATCAPATPTARATKDASPS